MKDFLSSQSHHIKRNYVAGTATPKLLMYRNEEDTSPDETLFIAHVPSSMVKNILQDKSLVKSRYEDL